MQVNNGLLMAWLSARQNMMEAMIDAKPFIDPDYRRAVMIEESMPRDYWAGVWLCYLAQLLPVYA